MSWGLEGQVLKNLYTSITMQFSRALTPGSMIFIKGKMRPSFVSMNLVDISVCRCRLTETRTKVQYEVSTEIESCIYE